jgi:hypothetical protein
MIGKKTKEECLLMNGIIGCDLGKNQARIMKAMDDWSEDQRSELLFAFANALNKECGFPLNSEGFKDYINEFLSNI